MTSYQGLQQGTGSLQLILSVVHPLPDMPCRCAYGAVQSNWVARLPLGPKAFCAGCWSTTAAGAAPLPQLPRRQLQVLPHLSDLLSTFTQRCRFEMKRKKGTQRKNKASQGVKADKDDFSCMKTRHDYSYMLPLMPHDDTSYVCFGFFFKKKSSSITLIFGEKIRRKSKRQYIKTESHS